MVVVVSLTVEVVVVGVTYVEVVDVDVVIVASCGARCETEMKKVERLKRDAVDTRPEGSASR